MNKTKLPSYIHSSRQRIPDDRRISISLVCMFLRSCMARPCKPSPCPAGFQLKRIERRRD